MIVQGFVELMEQNIVTLTQALMDEIRTRKETPHYRELQEDVLYARVNKVMHNATSRLANWLSKTKPKDTLFAYYRELGRERRREGIPLEEVVMVLMLVKRRIWNFLIDNQDFVAAYEIGQLIELTYAVGLFFDRVVLACITGYQAESRRAP